MCWVEMLILKEEGVVREEEGGEQGGRVFIQKRGSWLLACPKSMASSTSLCTGSSANLMRADVGETESRLRDSRRHY